MADWRRVLAAIEGTVDEDDATLHAVVDGARVPELQDVLSREDEDVESTCLYAGRLDAGMAAVAPYLLRMAVGAQATHWLLEHGWGRGYGIYASVSREVPFKLVRRHMRTLLKAELPDGTITAFRFYDPRVFRVYCPSLTPVEIDRAFGPVRTFFAESADAQLLSFPRGGAAR